MCACVRKLSSRKYGSDDHEGEEVVVAANSADAIDGLTLARPVALQKRWYLGMAVSAILTAAYYVRPIHMLILLAMAWFGIPTRLIGSLTFSLVLLSMFIQPRQSSVMVGRLLSPLLDYFDYDQIVENSPIHIRETMKEGKRYIFACQPHGIVPFCGMAWSIFNAKLHEGNPIPTAVASLVLYTPILQHVMGIFGIVSASRSSLRKTLQTKSIQLYVGSTTEIFDCTSQVEVLQLSKRGRGFIKFALQEGVDIIPVYMFGNTSIFSVWKHPWLREASQVLQLPFTYFWGVYGLPIPHNDKVGCLSGFCCLRWFDN